MRLLSSTKVKKTQGTEAKYRRRVNSYCLASIKVVGLVHVRRQEKRDRKIKEVTESFLLSKKEWCAEIKNVLVKEI